jgi:hypothetical protein
VERDRDQKESQEAATSQSRDQSRRDRLGSEAAPSGFEPDRNKRDRPSFRRACARNSIDPADSATSASRAISESTADLICARSKGNPVGWAARREVWLAKQVLEKVLGVPRSERERDRERGKRAIVLACFGLLPESRRFHFDFPTRHFAHPRGFRSFGISAIARQPTSPSLRALAWLINPPQI